MRGSQRKREREREREREELNRRNLLKDFNMDSRSEVEGRKQIV